MVQGVTLNSRKTLFFFFTHVTSFMYEMFLEQAKLESYYNKCYNWIRLTFLSGARNALITRGKKVD